MPPINAYMCTNCGLSLSPGWGGRMYVIDESGERIICGHPGEMATVARVLGDNAPRELIAARTGFHSDCICMDCLHQFKIDMNRDEEKCRRCGSRNIRTVREMIGKTCPKCKTGTIEEVETGIMT